MIVKVTNTCSYEFLSPHPLPLFIKIWKTKTVSHQEGQTEMVISLHPTNKPHEFVGEPEISFSPHKQCCIIIAYL